MRALVLNLAGAENRLAFIARQLDALGIAWERIEAVTPETLSPKARDPIWNRWERPLRETEMAACASHILAWQRVLEIGEPCLVLEDDALLDRSVPSLLAGVSTLAGCDHVSLETRGRRKVLSSRAHDTLPIRRMFLDRSGAAAYVLWPRGAQQLLSRAGIARGLADGMICAAHEMVSYQADPALAIQADRAAAHGWQPPIPVASQIGTEAKPNKGGAAYRLRRIRAQLIQGFRQLRPGTERREVLPKGDWIIPLSAHDDTTADH
jgi:glycosyl transferase family 25